MCEFRDHGSSHGNATFLSAFIRVYLRTNALVQREALERLKWRSRRGLLELDLVFERFWAGAGMKLDESEGAALERLLAMPDNDLLDLVMGKREAPDRALGDLVGKLRAA